MPLKNVIQSPVGYLIGMVVWLIASPMLMGALNQWYSQSIDAAVTDSERFDRIVKKGTNTAEEAWGAVTSTQQPNLHNQSGSTIQTHNPSATRAHIVEEGSSGGCRIGRIRGGATSARDIKFEAATYYTPAGTEVTLPFVQSDGHTTSSQRIMKDVAISGCKWKDSSGIFDAAGLGGLIRIILQAAGLAPPVAILAVLGAFGTSFIRNMGGHPILAAIVTVVAFLMVSTILNSLVPFLTDAFEAIDANRFVMYDSGLGNVSVIIKRFYGVVLVAGLIVVAWSVLQSMRGGNAISSGRM